MSITDAPLKETIRLLYDEWVKERRKEGKPIMSFEDYKSLALEENAI